MHHGACLLELNVINSLCYAIWLQAVESRLLMNDALRTEEVVEILAAVVRSNVLQMVASLPLDKGNEISHLFWHLNSVAGNVSVAHTCCEVNNSKTLEELANRRNFEQLTAVCVNELLAICNPLCAFGF